MVCRPTSTSWRDYENLILATVSHSAVLAGLCQPLKQNHFFNTSEAALFTNGPIPDEAFRGLAELSYLDMADNIYTSTVPSTLSELPSLEHFYLDNVRFHGVSESLSFMINMPAIRECWLDFTSLDGGIPTEIGKLSSLVSWSATFCGLR